MSSDDEHFSYKNIKYKDQQSRMFNKLKRVATTRKKLNNF